MRPLVADLAALGGAGLRVQCMDTAGPCIDAMLASGRVQATGFVYDCYLLDGRSAVVEGLRRRFWEQVERGRPEVFVVTDSVCYDQPHQGVEGPVAGSCFGDDVLLERQLSVEPYANPSDDVAAYVWRSRVDCGAVRKGDQD